MTSSGHPPHQWLVLDGRAWFCDFLAPDDCSVYVSCSSLKEARRYVRTSFPDGRIQRLRFIGVDPMLGTPTYDHDAWED